jgi:ABC-type transport system involved in multi-copper enzyme maturation permease subunit
MRSRFFEITLFGFMARRHRLGIGLAILIPIIMGVVVGILFPTYAPQREAFKVFKFAARFLGQGQIDPFGAESTFSLPFQHPLCLLEIAVVAGIAAMALPAGERGRGSLDLLLATPLERGTLMRTLIIFQIFVAGLAASAALFGALFGAWFGEAWSEIPLDRFLALGGIVAALTAFLAGLATWISVEARDRAQATLHYGIAVGVFFLLDVAARMWMDGQWLGWLTPYGYLRPPRVIAAEGLGIALRDAGVLLAGATLFFGVATWRQVNRRHA